MPLTDNSMDVLRAFCPAAGTCDGGGGDGEEGRTCFSGRDGGGGGG